MSIQTRKGCCMIKTFFDGLLSIYIIFSFVLLAVGNIARFVWWIKSLKIRKSIGMQYLYLDFWENEWGTECTKEEIEQLHQIIRQFQEGGQS